LGTPASSSNYYSVFNVLLSAIRVSWLQPGAFFVRCREGVCLSSDRLVEGVGTQAIEILGVMPIIVKYPVLALQQLL